MSDGERIKASSCLLPGERPRTGNSGGLSARRAGIPEKSGEVTGSKPESEGASYSMAEAGYNPSWRPDQARKKKVPKTRFSPERDRLEVKFAGKLVPGPPARSPRTTELNQDGAGKKRVPELSRGERFRFVGVFRLPDALANQRCGSFPPNGKC